MTGARCLLATVLEHLHKEHVLGMMERIKKMGEHSQQGWDYIENNYSALFGDGAKTRP